MILLKIYKMTLYLSHFFYTLNGGFMIIYIDGLLFLNFYLDFLLLLTVVVILKKNVKIFRIVLGAFIGSLTILVLFFKKWNYSLYSMQKEKNYYIINKNMNLTENIDKTENKKYDVWEMY